LECLVVHIPLLVRTGVPPVGQELLILLIYGALGVNLLLRLVFDDRLMADEVMKAPALIEIPVLAYYRYRVVRRILGLYFLSELQTVAVKNSKK
jgi:hypothetical protein